MTEEEAKTKWCPMGGRSVELADGVFNVGNFQRCVSSDCMMWVWDESFIDKDNLGEGTCYDVEGHCGLIK